MITANEALRVAVLLTADIALLPTVRPLSRENVEATGHLMRHRLAQIAAFVEDMERAARIRARAQPEPAPNAPRS